jgi:antitoxin component of MazEF toxin-antitoxin module
MPRLTVRRTGNSLGLPIPHEIVHDLGLSPGDELLVQLERVPRLMSLAGRLKGRITADEFTRLSNEGEELA